MSKHERIITVLSELHWLRLKQIKFKVAILTFKPLNEMAPQYLTELLEIYKPTRHLHSSSSHLLLVNRTTRKNIESGDLLLEPFKLHSLPT